MVIWFVNKEVAPSNEFATHMRTLRQAKFFQDKGYDVKVFCSAVVHNSKIVHKFDGIWREEIHDDVPLVFVKCPEYGESFVKRVLSFFVFSINILRIKMESKPDIIVHESKTPFDILCMRLANKYKARYIVDIEDLWPFEFEQVGLISHKNPFLKLFYRLQRFIYSKAEHVVISMEGGQDYVRERKWDKEQGGTIDINRVHYVNNGISLDEFNYNADNYIAYDEELTDKYTFKVIYLGSIRLANNLDQLLDAAKYLLDEPKIIIMIYGDGPEREKMEKRCENENIINVKFKNKWTELKYVPYVLSCADLHILNYSKNWAPYGGSMNKMMMAFASGKPMICNADMPYSEINRHQLGVDKVFATPEEYAEAIKQIYHLPKKDYDAMCDRVKEVAKRYDINYLCNKFAEYCEIS